MTTALLVIDVQKSIVDSKPYAITERLELWQRAVATCRQKGIEVIYVRHNDDELVTGTTGWEIADEITPLAGEMVIDKRYNSAFKETGLQAYLEQQGIDQLFVMGMLTNYCVDTTVKVAFELGYKIAVLENGTTTFDDDPVPAAWLIEHYENIWADRFAVVDFFDELIKED